MTYELFCNSVRGSSHVRKGTPCEDYCIATDRGEYKIFAVADGHGDPNCLRSNIGSNYICKIASSKLESFARTVKEQAWEEKLFDKNEAEQLVRQLIRSIVGEWVEAVGEELKQHPLSEEEIQNASAYAKEYMKGIKTERMYGTTLIAGLQTERYILLLQQGDGRCDVFDCNGNVSQPIPWDDMCIGNATTSLCDRDAVQSCRYHIIDLHADPVIACIAGTDGVEDSFPTSMEKMHAFYRELLKYACENGVRALETHLIDELDYLSTNGSADDVSVSGIVDIERVKPLLEKFDEKNRVVDLEDEVTIWTGKVQSIEEGGKLQYLTQKYKNAVDEYEKIEKIYRDLSDECDKLAETISAHEQGIPMDQSEDSQNKTLLEFIKKLILPQNSLSIVKRDYERKCNERDAAYKELQVVSEKKKTTEDEYLPYEDKHRDYIQKRDDAIARLNELKGR